MAEAPGLQLHNLAHQLRMFLLGRRDSGNHQQKHLLVDAAGEQRFLGAGLVFWSLLHHAGGIEGTSLRRSKMRHFATWAITAGILASTAATATAAPIVDFFVDFNDTPVVDLFNDPDNSTQTTAIGANAHIIGIGWDLEISALDPSFLSESNLSLSSATAFEVQITPAVGDDFSGTDNYSSGGVIDLIGLGLDFILGADGILYTQLFESFDDFPNAADGFWTGRVTVRAELEETAVPEPVTSMLLTLGAAGLASRARRRYPSAH